MASEVGLVAGGKASLKRTPVATEETNEPATVLIVANSCSALIVPDSYMIHHRWTFSPKWAWPGLAWYLIRDGQHARNREMSPALGSRPQPGKNR